MTNGLFFSSCVCSVSQSVYRYYGYQCDWMEKKAKAVACIIHCGFLLPSSQKGVKARASDFIAFVAKDRAEQYELSMAKKEKVFYFGRISDFFFSFTFSKNAIYSY